MFTMAININLQRYSNDNLVKTVHLLTLSGLKSFPKNLDLFETD